MRRFARSFTAGLIAGWFFGVKKRVSHRVVSDMFSLDGLRVTLDEARMIRITVLLCALCALIVSAPSFAEPVALDGHGAPAEEKPTEPKSITVPAGTAMMVRTSGEVSSSDKPGRKFSATLEANLMAGGDIAAKAGTQVYGQVVKSVQAGRGIVVSHANLVLGLTDINVEGTMYPIQTGSYAEDATGVILKRKSVVIPSGSLLEFRLTTPLTIKK